MDKQNLIRSFCFAAIVWLGFSCTKTDNLTLPPEKVQTRIAKPISQSSWESDPGRYDEDNDLRLFFTRFIRPGNVLFLQQVFVKNSSGLELRVERGTYGVDDGLRYDVTVSTDIVRLSWRQTTPDSRPPDMDSVIFIFVQ